MYLKLQTRSDILDSLAVVFHGAGTKFVQQGFRGPVVREKAERLANQWMERDIWVMESREVQAPEAWRHRLPPVLFAIGKRSLLDRPAAAILNSRKPRHIAPRDPWLVATKAMVRVAIEKGYTVVSSFGTPAYALVSVLARGSPVVVACDHVLPFMASGTELSRFAEQYRDLFDCHNTVFVSAFPPGKPPTRASRYFLRDHLVAALASTLMIAEVRPKGNMESVIRVAAKRKIPIQFIPPLASHSHVPAADKVMGRTVRKGIDTGVSADDGPPAPHSTDPDGTCQITHHRDETIAGNHPEGVFSCDRKGPSVWRCASELAQSCPYLIHYTRSCGGPWPGQTIADYLTALVEDRPGAAHTGFDSLLRILGEGVIRGSRRLTRGGSPVVCFTELFPNQLQERTSWRPGLLRWSFEPYGIAIKKDRLFELGARPVIYAGEAFFRDLSEDLHYLFQLHASQTMSWSAEREWRIKGDLALSRLSGEDMFLIVPRPEDAERVSTRFGFRVGLADVSAKECRSRACPGTGTEDHGKTRDLRTTP
jgi:hypothetical protein